MATSEDDQYEYHDATVRLCKGTSLSPSKKTAGAHRGLTRDANKKLGHAEIFLKDGTETDSPSSPQARAGDPNLDLYVDPRAARRQEITRDVTYAALNFAWEKAAPHVQRWVEERAVPAAKARWNKLRGREVESGQLASPAKLRLVANPDGESVQLQRLRHNAS